MVRFQELEVQNSMEEPSVTEHAAMASRNDFDVDEDMEHAKNIHGMIMIAPGVSKGRGPLSQLAAVSEKLLTTAISNADDSKSERSSQSSASSAGMLQDREYTVHELRTERQRLLKGGFVHEAMQLDPKIEFIRQAKIKEKEDIVVKRTEQKLSALKIRQAKDKRTMVALHVEQVKELGSKMTKAKIALVQKQQKEYEQEMERVMIAGSEWGRGTRCRYKQGAEVKRLNQNAADLRAKEQFREAMKFQKRADKIEKEEKRVWFKEFLEMMVGDHPNSVVARCLRNAQAQVDQHEKNTAAQQAILESSQDNERTRMQSTHRAEDNKVRQLIKRAIQEEERVKAKEDNVTIRKRNAERMGQFSKNLTQVVSSGEDVKTRVKPIRDDGTVWTAPQSSGVGNEMDNGEIDPDAVMKAPWEDSDEDDGEYDEDDDEEDNDSWTSPTSDAKSEEFSSDEVSDDPHGERAVHRQAKKATVQWESVESSSRRKDRGSTDSRHTRDSNYTMSSH